jgi:hypothetical protein
MIQLAPSFEERQIYPMIGRPKELFLKEKPMNFFHLILML